MHGCEKYGLALILALWPLTATGAPEPSQPIGTASVLHLAQASDNDIAALTRACSGGGDPTSVVAACSIMIDDTELAPNALAAAYNNRGTALAVLGNIPLAVEDLTQAIALDPSQADALFNRGVLLASQGDAVSAMADYNASLAIDPRQPAALYNRGNLFAAATAYEDAEVDYAAAIALDPQNAQARFNRSLALSRLGRIEEAMLEAESALALDPRLVLRTQQTLLDMNLYDGPIDGTYSRQLWAAIAMAMANSAW